MFPSIKPRMHTQTLSYNRRRISSSIFVKSRVKQSSIKACIPYIQELKYSSNHCNPKFSKHQSKKKGKVFTQSNETIQRKKSPSYYLTKQTDHEQNDPSILTEKPVKIKYTNRSKHKSNKIYSLLEEFQKLTQKIQSNRKSQSLEVPNNLKSKKFNQCVNEYENLPKSKMQWNQITTIPFIQSLSKINPFAKKLKSIVFLCLLKVGHVKLFQQNEIIQWQDQPYSKMIGIILWGEILIKNVNNKMKIYLFSGDSINQELIFQKDFKIISQNQQKDQIMKTKSSTAILFIKMRDYQLVYQQLVKVGQKNSILLVQNMMKWSYAKKKNTRNQFSHI